MSTYEPRTPRGTTCPTCGQVHPKCTGHKTGTVKAGNPVPCKGNPVNGLTVCVFHGGGSKAARAAAERRVTEAAATAEAARFATRRDIHPADALLELVQWTAGEVDYWRAKVDQLDDAELAGALVTKTEVGEDKGQPTDLTTKEAAEHIYIRMLAKSSDRLATYAAAALRAGVDERRVRLAEQQGNAVALVIRRILDALNLTDTQAELVPTIVPRELRALTSPKEPA
jgi:hypothetical protein